MKGTITRRGLLVGGGLGAGLLIAWSAWPRHYAPNLVAAPGETLFNAWLKIGEDGHVTVAVPQAETGQGVYTSLPQILADELGADWRTIAVEAAPINALYANSLIAGEAAEALVPVLPDGLAGEYARRSGLMVTAGSTSIRAFEQPLRDAGAAARVLLCKAAGARWDSPWESCDTRAGFVMLDDKRLRFGELAAEAATFSLPDPLPYRVATEYRLTGRSLPRLDLPAKIDGSANFAADIRLPGMVYAAVRQGPIGDSRIVHIDKPAADKVIGMLSIVENPGWVAAVATNWWAANKALTALAPRFETPGPLVDSAALEAALEAALDGDGQRLEKRGDLPASFGGATIHVADYSVAPAAHAALEPMTATADWSRDMLELWMPTQAPGRARAAVARALGIGVDRVASHPMMVGGGFGRALESDAAVQAAIIARSLKRPVQLVWSRVEDIIHDRFRAPAHARMAARLRQDGRVDGWLAKISAPATGRALARRLLDGEGGARAVLAVAGGADRSAISGAVPPYAIAHLAIDHHPADIGIPTGYWRSGADSYTAFFTECFIDELARVAQIDPFSYRMSMLGGAPRLARCLSTASALGGWQGGGAGTGQGIACHSSRGSHVAVVAEAHVSAAQKIVVDRIVAVADVGRQINPDLVRQQIEGGIVFGMAAALGASPGFADGLTEARTLRDLALPILADMPDISVQLIASDAPSGGAREIAVPPVAPAIANALHAASGRRLRDLPLRIGGDG